MSIVMILQSMELEPEHPSESSGFLSAAHLCVEGM